MADKKDISRRIQQLRHIRTWQLVILLILSLLIAATFLRLNNIGMIERRTAVINADKEGDQAITQARLFDLQRYAAAHMNANSGVVYLEAQYKRDVKKAVAANNDAVSSEKTVRDRKIAYERCAKQFSYYSYPWTLCIGEELAKLVKDSPTNLGTTTGLPSTELYKHEFVSPRWSPDFAGFTVLISIIIVIVIVGRLLSLMILYAILRWRYQSI